MTVDMANSGYWGTLGRSFSKAAAWYASFALAGMLFVGFAVLPPSVLPPSVIGMGSFALICSLMVEVLTQRRRLRRYRGLIEELMRERRGEVRNEIPRTRHSLKVDLM